MCLFPYKNLNEQSPAYKRGILEFSCGSCPECLQKKSRQWALRAAMEAKRNVGMMITLTYDTYIYNSQGDIIGEQLPPQDLKLSKRDVQNFFKRLRSKFPDKKISYIATAERGKRTNRPHYHCLVFGLVFDDCVKYKRSKRGNSIYRSKTLEEVWHGGKTNIQGICTVDCKNISVATARYCTKYCAKDSGADDTFMLFSRGIGEAELIKRFNGKNYIVDGREYSIPRTVWQKVIEKKYNIQGYSKYYNFPSREMLDDKVKSFINKHGYNIKLFSCYVEKWNMSSQIKAYFRHAVRRDIYSVLRDNDSIYKTYIAYWKRKNFICELTRPPVFQRILNLPNGKYRSYKNKALRILGKKNLNISFVPPRSDCKAQSKRIQADKGMLSKGGFSLGELSVMRHLACRARHYTPNDRIFAKKILKTGKVVAAFCEKWQKDEKNPFI